MNALTTTQPGMPSATALLPTNINDAMRLAEMMSKARLLPQAVQNPADAFPVINQAMRWNMDPFAVAQEVSVISGKLMHSGKIVAAAINSSDVLDGRLRYDYRGEGNDRTITVSGTLRGEREPRSVEVRLADAKTSNAMWTKQPDQQLAYFGSRVWARRNAPSVSHWLKWSLAAIGKMENGAALSRWQSAMEAHLDAVEEVHPAEAQQVRSAASDRLDELAQSWDEGATA